MTKAPVRSAALQLGPLDGAVTKGQPLTQLQAEHKRKAGEDVVVCGPDLSPDQAFEPVVSIRLEPFGPEVSWPAITILLLKQNDNPGSLIYVLSDRIRQHPSSRGWRFSKLRVHWLYDEVDVDESQRGHFLHRVLLSDGGVLEIPVLSVRIRRVPLSPSTGGEMARTSA